MTPYGVVVLLVLCGMAFAENEYLITLPKEIRPSMTFNFSVMLFFPPPAGSYVKVSLRESQSTDSMLLWPQAELIIYFTPSNTLYEGSFDVAPSSLYSGSQHFFHTEWTGLKKLLSGLKKMDVVRPSSPVIPSTDKGIYKPGDLVKIIVVIMNKELKPERTAYKIMIKDPLDNTLMVENMDPNDDSYQSVRKMEFALPEEAILGSYIIGVETLNDNSYTEVPFVVEEYVLPKFDVKMTIRNPIIFLTESSDYSRTTIGVHVKSHYTFGKSVAGELKLYINGILQKTVRKFEGNYSSELPLPDRASMYRVRAEVYEKHTDIMANATALVKVMASHLKAEVVKPIPYRFIGEKTYTFLVMLKNADGGPFTEDYMDFIVRYCINRDAVCAEMNVTSNPQIVTIPSSVNGVKTDFGAQIKVEFISRVPNGVLSSKDTFTPVLYDTLSKQPFHMNLVNSPNQDVCFTVSPCKDGEGIYYQVVNNFYQEPMQIYTCGSQMACITPNPMHAPVSMIIAYKVQDFTYAATRSVEKELITASVRFTSSFTTNQQVSLNVSPTTAKPKETVNIQIRTKGKALAFLGSVDVSLDLLAKANDVTLKKLEEIFTYVRLFERTKENPYPNPPGMLFRGMPEAVAVERKKRSICFRCGDYFSNINAEKIMEDAGGVFMTNLKVSGSSGNAGDNEDGAAEKDSASAVDNSVNTDEADVRQDFPETWLFDLLDTNLVETSNEGLLSREETVPDTMTSWNFKAWAINEANGIGVAEQKKLTVFQEFFLSMNLPYSVVRNERFNLQILVFNYKEDPIEVSVQLKPDEAQFTIVPGLDQDREQLLNQVLTVGPDEVGSAEIPIMPIEAGELEIEAMASEVGNANNRDIVRRKLIVKFEGSEKSEAQEQAPIRLPDGAMETVYRFSDLTSMPMDKIVPDSAKIFVHVTGDMMGPFIENLEGKIRMPYGCGEQNIKSLSPSIFVAKYLKAVNRFNSEAKQKCQKYSAIGYQRQLKYFHSDGGCSAFGEGAGLCTCRGEAPDKNPASTWLTAFVLKAFSQLALQDLTYVSRVRLQKAFEFLKSKMYRGSTATFTREDGNVIHQEMTGGTSAGIGLSAFSMVSMLSLRDLAVMDGNTYLVNEIDPVIQDGLRLLIDEKLEIESKESPYLLALTACTLAKGSSMVDDESFQNAEDMLMKFEEIKDNMAPTVKECPNMYGRRPGLCAITERQCQSDDDCITAGQLCCNNGCNRECMEGIAIRPLTGPTKVEMYGYALLAYTRLADLSSNFPVLAEKYRKSAETYVDLLISLKQPGGNWMGTQDTVVALEALATYASTFPATTQTQFTVEVTDVTNVKSFVFNSDNFLTTQFASFNGPVELSVTGTSGTAYITVEARYNTMEEITLTPIMIDIETFTSVNGNKVIETCVRNKQANVSLSSMMTVTVNCGSGLQYDGVDNQDTAYAVQRLEADTKECQVTYYYSNDEDNFKTPRCYRFKVKEEFQIADRKAGSVMVRDYYAQEHNAELNFVPSFSAMEQRTTTEGPTTGCSHVMISASLVVAMVMAVIATSRQ